MSDDGVAGSSYIEVRQVAPNSGPAKRAMRAYLQDVASRFYGRAATDEEVEAGLLAHTVDDLVQPHGFFLVALDDASTVLGCVALARVAPRLGEVRRLHVAHEYRRRGLGRRLMVEVERRAREMGFDGLRLDTRNDLIESQRLYDSLGYVESPAHSGGPYSDRWYSKELS